MRSSKYIPDHSNRPPHKIDLNGYYFITARTVESQWFLQPEKYKQILLNTISSKTKKFEFPLIAYVILNNHYHLIIDIKDTDYFSKLMNEINGASSKAINEADRVKGRKIWWNYYEKYLRDEKDFYTHLNYLHQNPIKHRIFPSFDYKYSSYRTWVKKRGIEYVNDSFEKYPVIDFKAFNDEM